MESNTEKSYINSVIARHFGDKEVNDPAIPITGIGWYWADKFDNARYTDFHGVFESEAIAIAAGKKYRSDLIKNNFEVS